MKYPIKKKISFLRLKCQIIKSPKMPLSNHGSNYSRRKTLVREIHYTQERTLNRKWTFILPSSGTSDELIRQVTNFLPDGSFTRLFCTWPLYCNKIF